MTRGDNAIRFVQTDDRVRLAWTVSGDGPSLVKAANWLTHLEYDLESPVWKHWIDFLSGHFRYYRHDERGLGLSSHQVEDMSRERWSEDLELIIETAKPETPFVLLGISQGSGPAMRYAAKYPERVSHLVIYGGYQRGWGLRDPEEKRRRQAVRELALVGWGTSDPIFRRLYTKMFLPEGTDDQLRWFDELCAKTTTPEIAYRLMAEQAEADFTGVPETVSVPTLVLHGRDDRVVPFAEGVDIATAIQASEFVQLDTCNHILMPDEPAWERFRSAVLEFTGRDDVAEDAIFGSLSDRERQVLSKVAEGLGNTDIADTLFISEKTVKNHITRIFEKLHVKTRSQAIVLARDKNFAGASD